MGLNRRKLEDDIKAVLNTIPALYNRLRATPKDEIAKDKWHVDLLCTCGVPIGVALHTIWKNGSLFVADTAGLVVQCGTCKRSVAVDDLSHQRVQRHLGSVG